MATPGIRVLLADDNDLFRDLLGAALEEDFGFDVVGKARDGRQAVDLARELRPDVVVADLRMPGLGGDVAAAEISVAVPEVRVVIMTLDEHALRDRNLARVADAFFLKDEPVEELVAIIRRVAGGAVGSMP